MEADFSTFGIPIHPVDAAIIVIVVISSVVGFARGFVREILAIGAWVGAVLATVFGFGIVRDFARDYVTPAILADFIAGASIFITVLLVLSGISRAAGKSARSSLLGPLDRTLGVVFGILRGALVISALYLFVFLVMGRDSDPPKWGEDSKLLPWAEVGAGILYNIPEWFGDGSGLPGRKAKGDDLIDKMRRNISGIKTSDSDGESGYKRSDRTDMDTLIGDAKD